MADEKRLATVLLDPLNYDNTVRPVYNASHKVSVGFEVALIQIMDMVSVESPYHMVEI